MRLLMFAVAVAAALAAPAQQMYHQPTYAQVERLIAAVNAGASQTPQQGPTFEQMADLITAVRESVLRQQQQGPTTNQMTELIQAVKGNAPLTNVTVEVEAQGARYLAMWDCATGLPLGDRASVEYRPGDMYLVGVVSDDGVNYRPAPSNYVVGVASAEAETNKVYAADAYWYDGSGWRLVSYGPLADNLIEYGLREVVRMTGIHIGEENSKTQYVKGVWAETATPVQGGDKTIEIGVNAHATETADHNQAIAIGRDSLSVGAATVAVGPNSFAEGEQAVALGWRANAVGAHAVSVGSANAKLTNHEDYYKDGNVNSNSNLHVAGPYAVAVGFNDKATGTDSVAIGREAMSSTNSAMAIGSRAAATAEGAVQIGTGTNSAPHTLKFEDVVIVKDGRVVGSAVPEPETVEPSAGAPGSDTDYDVAVSPGALVTIMPSVPIPGGATIGIDCSGMRNYTVYCPNEPELREGLPVAMRFDLPDGTRHATPGPLWAAKLPVRYAVEQPYGGLVVITPTVLDDGYDWTPVVTNCSVAYNMDGRFVCRGSSWSIQGQSLQCATAFTLSYPLADGGTNTVSLITLPEGQPYYGGTLFGSAPSVECSLAAGETPEVTEYGVPAVLRYTTVNGTTEFSTTLDVFQD